LVNDLKTLQLFSEKINTKVILEKINFSTPVFEKIGNRDDLELFNNFIQPSRIFSKNNDFYSSKISSLIDLKKIFETQSNIQDYYIEEYIDGEEIYVLAFKDINNNWLISNVKSNNNIFENIIEDLDKEIKQKVISFLDFTDIQDLAFLNLVYVKKRGLYFLNIYLQNNFFIENSKIFDNILSKKGIWNLEKVFKKDLL